MKHDDTYDPDEDMTEEEALAAWDEGEPVDLVPFPPVGGMSSQVDVSVSGGTQGFVLSGNARVLIGSAP